MGRFAAIAHGVGGLRYRHFSAIFRG